jgi:GntR family transcriptional regulator/MocR family aminotransferase
MTTSRADLPVVVDRRGQLPMAAQTSAQVREAVTAGVLRAGEQLPSTRDLAAALAVSRTVVTTAYAQLFAEGWLEGRHGSGTYKVGVEEPGYPSAREVLRQTGAQVVPCRVDAHGIVPGELPADLRLLYTTPAHQYPLGGRLPVGRRQAIIAWARATGAIIVEDDYDSEFRYDVGPLPALYSMDPEVIVYLGTASKTLTAAFGAGWLVASEDLVRRLAGMRRSLADRVPEPVQHALLAMLTSGDLERHIRRMRLEYARRRVELFALDSYFDGPPAMNGLILGYGTASLPKVRRAARVLRDLLAHLPG